MKKLLVIILLCLSGTVVFAQSLHYEINTQGMEPMQTTITGLLAIDHVQEYNGEGMQDAGGAYLEIGVFDQDDICRGTVLPKWRAGKKYYLYQLQLRGISGMTYPTMRVYDHQTETEMDLVLDIEETLVWTSNGSYGSTSAPYEINFTHSAGQSWTRAIAGYETLSNPNGGYVLIASPVDNFAPADAGLTTDPIENFDLFRFNQEAIGGEWENYKLEGDHYHFDLEAGRGYLYACKEGTEFTVTGTPYSGDGLISLLYKETATFPGFNLIGNPFTTDAGLFTEGGSERMPYYTMDADGLQFDPTTGSDDVPCMFGVLVQATGNGQYAKFIPADGKRGYSIAQADVILSNNGKKLDKAIIRFDDGMTLGKFQQSGNTRIYFPQDGEEYAIANANSNEMPLNFQASEAGTYTISIKPNNANITYLHLFDKLTGEDVNLFTTPEYSFVASPRDAEGRFIVRFNETSANGTFIYQNGDELIVNGNGTLQVFDMMGRFMGSYEVNGNKRINASQYSNGVYVFRMIGETINTQKIVVR